MRGSIRITTYKATGCEGVDVITARATVNGTLLEATGSVTVQPAAVGTLEFVSATPTNIGLKGTGLNEQSVVRFQIKDKNGNPVGNKQIDFSLETTVGGITLDPVSAISTADGYVETTVSSGTVPTTVKVKAQYATNPSIATMSDGLVVSTGIADDDSFTLSLSAFNPEGWDIAGVEVTVTAFAADRFNNPVPDGTAIYFTTEGGAINPSCNTVDGKCAVIWRSQNPHPAWLGAPDPKASDSPGGIPFPGGGRATIRAHMIGEESFVDRDGDGVFGDGDDFTDRPEPFRDDNENGIRDADEPIADFNENGTYDGVDGKYNGLLCKHSSLCSPKNTTYVYKNAVIVMSTSFAWIEVDPPVINFQVEQTQSVTIRVWDRNGNLMPAGTTVAVSTDAGSVSGKSSFTVPNSSALGPSVFAVSLKGKADPENGILDVLVTSPRGDETVLKTPVQIVP